MIELRDIRLSFGQRTLIDSASATLRCGTITALLGRNGTGKSTLLRAMASLGDVQRGEIRVDGRPLRQMNAAETARRIAFVDTSRIHAENMSARELVAIGRSPYTDWLGRTGTEDMRIVDEAMTTAGVAGLADRMVDTLSDGECQRVMIARALAQTTPVILLDEPTAFLDMPNRYELCTLLQRLAHRQGKCIVFSTHDLDIALSLCDEIALIDSPRLHHMPTRQIVGSGYIERLFSSPYVRFDAATQSITLTETAAEG